jgi:hypothetical protein
MKAKGKYSKASDVSAPEVLRDRADLISTEPESRAMIRTQIYLNRAEYDFLQIESRRRNAPMAAVIRSYIDEKMHVPDEIWENNPLLAPPADPKFVGPEDGAINHDHYLYGTPKKWVKRRGKWVEAPPLPGDYYSNPKSAAAYDRSLEGSK